MKTTQLFFTGVFLVSAFFANAQNNASNSDITSGGLFAGITNTGNTFYGFHAGTFTSDPMTIPNQSIGNNNTCIGHRAGNTFGNFSESSSARSQNNVFIGYNARFKNSPIIPVNGSGNVYIGTDVGTVKTDNKLMIDNSTTNFPLIWGDFALDQLKFNGKVGVGYGFGNFPTTAGTVNVSGYNLFVNGGILTEEVRVMLKNDWADYVFEESYHLPNLEEVEMFIKENKHLPNVPSAKEVAQNGIELGEIATIQQEKIEELTLYVIEQNNINKEQAQQLEKQQSEIEELKEQVKFLLEKSK